MFEPFAIALCRGSGAARLEQFRLNPGYIGPLAFNASRVELTERIKQRAMSLGVEQSAVIMLPVNLDRERADVAEQSGGNARTADECAAAAVALQGPPDDQRLARLALYALLGQSRQLRVAGGVGILGRDRRRL